MTVESTPQALKGNGETVLLVEDETSLRQMGKTMLERSGYSVIAASTPSEAFTLAKEHAGKIDLLLTDVVMPEMNENIKASKSNVQNIAMPFISFYNPFLKLNMVSS